VAEPVPLRLSIGVTHWLSDGAEADAGQAGITDFARHRVEAETAMYEARRQGGDRYVAAVELAPAAG
jgi:GGDEF domain-containing protein